MRTPLRALATWTAILFSFALGANAQWLHYPTPGVPRLPDGKPNLAAPAPRTAEGHPDLSGVWMHEITTVADVKRIFGNRFDGDIAGSIPGMEIGTQHKYGLDIFADFHPPDSAMTPEGIAMHRKRMAAVDPSKVCTGVLGWPLSDLLSEPIKIIQAPKVTIILTEAGYLHRQIFSDGRKLPKEFELPAYLGYSVGRWDGDTFLVETAGFNDLAPLDWGSGNGHVHSDALRLTERFRRRNFGNLELQMTLDDPKVFVHPFTISIPHHLLADEDIYEMFCENEKDAAHMRQ